MIDWLINGVAISAIWLWTYVLLTKDISIKPLKYWVKYILPQGIMIAWALKLKGII